MGGYVRLLGSLVQNLVRRAGEDLADCAAVCRRGLVYKLRSFRMRYDDVGPGGVHDFQLQPEQLAVLVKSVQNKPWFCELDRRAAQVLVYSGGSGCFVIRPSASTRSLTLTLWYHHRAYNILIRQREDGLLALGSKKSQEMTFRSVEEMVCHYEREPLILYSGGELTGRTRLRAPPPGLVRGRASTSSDATRRSSDSSEKLRRSNTACSRTLSSGNCDVPFSSTRNKNVERSTMDAESSRVLRPSGNMRGCSSDTDKDNDKDGLTSLTVSLKDLRVLEGSKPFRPFPDSNISRIPRSSNIRVPGKIVPALKLSVANVSPLESTSL